MLNPPLFVGYQSSGSAQTLATATFTAILLDTSVVDTYSGHSTVTNKSRYTAQVPGWYDVEGQVSFAENATGRRIASLWVNGSELGYTRGEEVPGASAVAMSCNTAGHIFLNAGDYVEMYGFQSSGGNLATAPSPVTLNVRWVHL